MLRACEIEGIEIAVFDTLQSLADGYSSDTKVLLSLLESRLDVLEAGLEQKHKSYSEMTQKLENISNLQNYLLIPVHFSTAFVIIGFVGIYFAPHLPFFSYLGFISAVISIVSFAVFNVYRNQAHQAIIRLNQQTETETVNERLIVTLKVCKNLLKNKDKNKVSDEILEIARIIKEYEGLIVEFSSSQLQDIVKKYRKTKKIIGNRSTRQLESDLKELEQYRLKQAMKRQRKNRFHQEKPKGGRARIKYCSDGKQVKQEMVFAKVEYRKSHPGDGIC